MENKYQCSLCSNTVFKKIPFRYAFNGRYLYGQKCKSCGLISIFPRPSEEEIKQMYSDEYYTIADNKTHHGDSDYINDILKIDFTEQINFIKSFADEGNFLEVGCATGAFLNKLKANGFNVSGVELSSYAAEYGKKNYGIDIINKAFDNNLLGNEFSENSFDFVFMGDVLEHFINPKEAVELSYKLLKKGGKLITYVPGTLNLISSKLAFIFYNFTGSQKTMTIPPFHLTEFSPGTLEKIFLHAGFTNIKIIQHTKHPKTIPLRHSKIENLIKLSIQYPNYYITKYFGILGDRITGIATKQAG